MNAVSRYTLPGGPPANKHGSGQFSRFGSRTLVFPERHPWHRSLLEGGKKYTRKVNLPSVWGSGCHDPQPFHSLFGCKRLLKLSKATRATVTVPSLRMLFGGCYSGLRSCLAASRCSLGMCGTWADGGGAACPLLLRIPWAPGFWWSRASGRRRGEHESHG